MQRLVRWSQSGRRKPLLLQGARQVGKTYLVQQFGQRHYERVVYLNLEFNEGARRVFAESLDPKVILEKLSFVLGHGIPVEGTLLFLDEIQRVPRAITSLKYFQEQAPELHLIAAGSLLGVQLDQQTAFPVGKVQTVTLYPMSFFEYLRAAKEDYLLDQLQRIRREDILVDTAHERALELFKKYMFLGGMPEVVASYLERQDVEEVREIQREILSNYERDFAKYSTPTQTLRIGEIWRSIPIQLARENKKFKFREVKDNARSTTHDLAMAWLLNAGLILPVHFLSTPKLPLAAYVDRSKFKMYLLDTGLLGALLRVPAASILEPDRLFREFNGAFTENVVAQELLASGIDELQYWQSRGTAEVDFVFTRGDEPTIYPLEVKSGLGKNTKSLRAYADKYQPEHLYRASPRNLRTDDDFTNLPLYLVSRMGADF